VVEAGSRGSLEGSGPKTLLRRYFHDRSDLTRSSGAFPLSQKFGSRRDGGAAINWPPAPRDRRAADLDGFRDSAQDCAFFALITAKMAENTIAQASPLVALRTADLEPQQFRRYRRAYCR
jgi:hypothetical protein